MHLLLDILQGAGLAAVAGVRPLPTLLVAGGLGAADAGLSFDGTRYAFLESPGFLVGVAVAFAVLTALQVRRAARPEGGPIDTLFVIVAVVAGALLFAGSLADRGHAAWPGELGGAACAALAIVATRGLLRRTSERLKGGAPVGLYTAAGCAGAAALIVLAPPLALLLLGFLARLALGARRRGGERYAGLRILR
jgi:hypothetical protein